MGDILESKNDELSCKGLSRFSFLDQEVEEGEYTKRKIGKHKIFTEECCMGIHSTRPYTKQP